ncbi:hypothetical protein BCR43DRAFT_499156 [Syncephalastrum racemosum]|uniref:Uncharacterized protein n=1 Tax=Syncephalastrum racemosum TaxID=13706 RepID=A0A1X2H119_SYNRA|nr:hypothetical protein BCR43DRAFT_499156 [Syncephalastrum racemosum]
MTSAIAQQPPILQKLAVVNEQAWISLGNLAEIMNDLTRAMNFFKFALKHNPNSVPALSRIAALYRSQEQFDKAIKYYRRILSLKENHGEIWGALGHCYLMMEQWEDAYAAYQQALCHLPDPKDPKLWYGIGILYDRHGSIEHAEEAFSAVIKMDPNFDKANEIYFRLGIIYKQQQRYPLSLQCFRYILQNPPKPLTEVDIWYQTGHVYEQQQEYEWAKDAYERVLNEKPDDAKVLQQYGWLFHQPNTSFCSQNKAIEYLTRSLKADSNDAQSWYFLGRCYIAEQNYNKAYEAYQQAVYRDAQNPAFWCSIGVLYYRINQYHDALDAYNRAIRINPNMSEVWYDLGTLYESSKNQIQDALDAYQRAADLDPHNAHIRQRLEVLRRQQHHREEPPSTPVPLDISNPYHYQSTAGGAPAHPTASPPMPVNLAHPKSPQRPQPPPPMTTATTATAAATAIATKRQPTPPYHPNHKRKSSTASADSHPKKIKPDPSEHVHPASMPAPAPPSIRPSA